MISFQRLSFEDINLSDANVLNIKNESFYLKGVKILSIFF